MTRYFVINDKNYDYIQRQSDQPHHIPNGWNKAIIGLLIVLYLFVFGALGMAILSMHQENILFQDSAQTTARITGKHVYQRGRNNTSHDLTYLYIVDNQVLSDSRTVSREVYYSHEIGDTVDITYAIASPDLTRMVGVHGDNRSGFVAGFTILFAGLAAYGVYSVIKRHRDVNLLKASGVLITGQLIDYSTRYYKSNYYVRFNVQFANPNYKTIKGSREYQVNYLKDAVLPSAGAPLAVIYHNEDLWEVL